MVFVRRWLSFVAVLVAAASLPACAERGKFRLLGYTTKPPYDTRIKTVHVPIFRNEAFQSGPLRGLEYQLTEAVQKQIELVSPYKVVSYRETADTELLGTIKVTPVGLINRNQLNEIREGEMQIHIEVVWRDLRSGEILSLQGGGPGGHPLRGDPNQPPRPVIIRAPGRFLPELAESQATGLQRACRTLAVQIASLMEEPWGLPNE